MKKTEKEIRGKFKDRKEMYEFLARIGAIAQTLSKRKRLSVLFTSGNSKGIDLQVRLHNLDGEIILKKGKHEGILREENVIKITHEQFIPSIFFIYNLGFKNAVVANCIDWIFNLNDDEIKLTECDNKIFCWEIESKNQKQSTLSLSKLAKTFGLKNLKEIELKQYWLWMKKYGNKKFNINTIDNLFKKYLQEVKNGKGKS